MKEMARRTFLQALTCGTAGLFSGNLQAGAANRNNPDEPGKRPNILFIITDDQGYGDLGCHGNPVLKTPRLDRLHGESIRLTRFHTSPVCSPTRASLMTGRYNYRTGVVDTYAGRSMMDPRETTLPELLAAEGYHTGIFGKWHLGDNYPLRPIDRGFEEALIHCGGGIAQPSDPEFYERENTYFDPVLQHNGVPLKCPGYCTDVFTNAAIDFINQQGTKPFFAYVAYNAPHTPLQAPDTDKAPYIEAGLDETSASLYGMISNLDRNVGRLLDALDDRGIAENTLVLFMTDNGSQDVQGVQRFKAGLRGWKGTVYDGGIRVPCFLRWPATFPEAREMDAVAAHIDIMPTLLEACGISNADHPPFDGLSLLPLLTGKAAALPERTLFFQWHRGDIPEAFKNAAVRTPRWKLVNGTELYDMVKDPGENSDLAGAHPEVVEQLRGEYLDWFADVSGTRGYGPVRIHIGNVRQNPVVLTRQDWHDADNWMAEKAGYWEVCVDSAGEYEVRATFAVSDKKRRLHLSLGQTTTAIEVEANTSGAVLENLSLETGAGRLECWLDEESGKQGVRFLDIQKK